MSELLCFFAKTHHSSVPIVEDPRDANLACKAQVVIKWMVWSIVIGLAPLYTTGQHDCIK